MASRPANGLRDKKLYAVLIKTVKGEHPITTAQDAKLFLEAVISQTEPVACVELIMSTTHGIPAFQTALHSDLSLNQLNGAISDLLQYFQSTSLKLAGSGMYLEQIVRAFAQPPILWSALLQAHKARQLNDDAVHGFAWLLQRLLYLPKEDITSYLTSAVDLSVLTPLLESARLDIRTAGERVKHISTTASRLTASITNEEDAPGGRHNNDFASINDISILPTPDEVLSKELPFLRRARDLDECTNDILPSAYIDNHFRLLREDMIQELREDLEEFNKKKGGRKALILKDLWLSGVQCTTFTASPRFPEKQVPWMLQLCAYNGLPQLVSLDSKKRTKFITEN